MIVDQIEIPLEDQTVELDGQTYVWSYGASNSSWAWRTTDYVEPPTGIKSRLNRRFIEQHADRIAQSLEPTPQFVFVDVLRKMGASNDEIEKTGLSAFLELQVPEYGRERRFKKMPPAGHTPFNNSVLRDWLFAWPATATNHVSRVACLGDGPFARDEFASFLSAKGFDCKEISESTEAVILGRSEWDADEVDEAIDSHIGRCLRIYSQEMFLAYLAKQEDPFLGGEDVLAAFRAGHEGLEFVSQGWPGWVQTFVGPNRSSPSTRSAFDFEVEESPLRVMGYTVGQHGEQEETRHEILKRAFCEHLPIVGPSGYMQQWGEPSSAQRLKKIADNVSTYCRNARGRVNPPLEAIDDWESDLEWLRNTFYHGHMRFHWPNTLVY